MKVCPRSVDSPCTVDGDLSIGREAVIPPIRVAADERRVMSVVADTTASHGIRVTCNDRSKSHKGRNDGRLHLASKCLQENIKNENKAERTNDDLRGWRKTPWQPDGHYLYIIHETYNMKMVGTWRVAVCSLPREISVSMEKCC